MPKKTRLPEQIVTLLRRDPTATRQQLADRLGVSYQAVQKHLRRMEQDGLVLPGFVVTERWREGRHEFWIFVETRYDRELEGERAADYQAALCRDIAAELTDNETWAADLSFAGTHVLLGSNWDVVLRLHAADPDAVGRFVTRFLRAQPTIVRTSTAWILPEGPGHPDV